MNLEKFGDILIWVVMIEYLIAATVYLFVSRGWYSIYWGCCALLNLAVLMIKKHQ